MRALKISRLAVAEPRDCLYPWWRPDLSHSNNDLVYVDWWLWVEFLIVRGSGFGRHELHSTFASSGNTGVVFLYPGQDICLASRDDSSHRLYFYRGDDGWYLCGYFRHVVAAHITDMSGEGARQEGIGGTSRLLAKRSFCFHDRKSVSMPPQRSPQGQMQW